MVLITFKFLVLIYNQNTKIIDIHTALYNLQSALYTQYISGC